jgi:hypothetical protein
LISGIANKDSESALIPLDLLSGNTFQNSLGEHLKSTRFSWKNIGKHTDPDQ